MADTPAPTFAGPTLGPVPLEFILFTLVLAGVAVLHLQAMKFAVLRAIGIAAYKALLSPFSAGAGLNGLARHLEHEWVVLTNLLWLLGFALLARHFEDSQLPAKLPALNPDDWTGCFALLVMVFALSAFVDNIAAAMIGGAIARTVFKGACAHRLPGGHRRCLERWRCRQRGGRHLDHDDVDCRRHAGGSARGLHCRRGGAAGLRRARRAAS